MDSARESCVASPRGRPPNRGAAFPGDKEVEKNRLGIGALPRGGRRVIPLPRSPGSIQSDLSWVRPARVIQREKTSPE